MNEKKEILEIFEDAYVVISTPKPIMAIKYNNIKDNYEIVYMTRDQVLKKDNKRIFLKEYLGGITTKIEIRDLIENRISVYNFLEETTNKQRLIKANEKRFEPKEIDSIEKYSKNLPDKDISLSLMPKSSLSPLIKLKKIIDYEIKMETDFKIKPLLNKSVESERKGLKDEQGNSGIKGDSYDELPVLSYAW
ncbi:hypothetical protein [Vagococcus lutrae]|uniref:hypothetical protein n=1 Tax=Vagococcus lutrae TaxID=81947 RepID=UPI00288F9F94|nr:hypothetical protein [Vagococcus lutrae]MDT2843018.1 hypothetical protein [Vagococcus lutrae]